MKHYLSFSLIFTLLFFISRQSAAQLEAGNYTFTPVSGTYTPLTGSTNLDTLEDDDVLSDPIALGFTFYFEGVPYDSVRVSSNGFLTFNHNDYTATSTLSNELMSSDGNIRPLVAPLWDDLDGDAPGGSAASYVTTGTAPNRVFSMEWSAWEWQYDAEDSVISFQVHLYEGTNDIEFVYRRESAAPVDPSASIGIAGMLTGAGNFLSLDSTGTAPNASSTTETDDLDTLPATGQIYRFSPPVSTDTLDMRAINVLWTNVCPTNNETIWVVVQNVGADTIDFSVDNMTVGAILTGPNPTTLTSNITSGMLNPFETDTLPVTTTYDMSAAGTYTVQGFTGVSGDTVTTNDTMPTVRTIENLPLAMTAQGVTFTGYDGSNLDVVFPGWSETSGEIGFTNGTSSDWRDMTDLGNPGNVTAAINLYSDDNREWIMGPKVVAVEGAELGYKVAVTDWDDVAVHDTMGSDDKMYVLFSTNCGLSWQKVDSVSAADTLPMELTKRTVDLTPYAGDEIMIAFFATDGDVADPEDYDLHLDDISIRSMELLSPPSGTVYVNEGIGTDTLDAMWTADDLLDGPLSYVWLADTVGGDFTNPYALLPSNSGGLDTMLTLSVTAIDVMLNNLGVAVGDSIHLMWTVRAYDATDSTEAKEPFEITIVRGELLQDFSLTTPADGSAFTIEGNETTLFNFEWQKSIDSAGYVLLVETPAGAPLITQNTDTANSMSFDYGTLHSLLLGGVSIGSSEDFRWTVGAIYAGDTIFATNGYFDFTLTAGALTSAFNLLDPNDGEDFTIEGDSSQTIEFTWEDAQSNGDGDITYTWHLDDATGDFSAPVYSLNSDNSGVDESITVTYGELALVLSNAGVNIGEDWNGKWTVVTNYGDTATLSFSINLERGVLTGINEEKMLGGLSLFPNPSNGTFRLVADDLTGGMLNVEVTDLNGRVLLNDRLAPANGQLLKTYDFNEWSEGIYLFRVYNNTATQTMRLVIQK